MTNTGIITIKSTLAADETANRLDAILLDKGMKIVARVNHAAAAASVDETLPHSEVFIFGNPKSGTPLMQSQPTMALDLPQKMLVWQDADDQVWISYNAPDFLAQRHGIDDRDELIQKTSGALAAIANAAAG